MQQFQGSGTADGLKQQEVLELTDGAAIAIFFAHFLLFGSLRLVCSSGMRLTWGMAMDRGLNLKFCFQHRPRVRPGSWVGNYQEFLVLASEYCCYY
eukprot:2588270-Rhodomonas_salina.4